MKKVLLKDLEKFCVEALVKSGLNENDAKVVADVLITTDTFGVLSHGTKNLYQYIQKMTSGGLNAGATPTVRREGPAWAMVDGNAAIGMLSSYRAMELAIKKAKETGIAYVGVSDSCHFGAAGYYANMAAKEGMIGISMSNADPNMAIPNSKDVAIGNNPFSFAAPLADGKSVFLDIALSSVAALKIVMAKEKGIKVPKEWLIDNDGRPTDDPSEFPYGSHLQPMAAHKGYGFATMVEVLASVITGAGILSQVASWNLDMPTRNNAGHAFIAIDVSQMMPREEFAARMEQMVNELHSAPLAKDAKQIFLPGEMEWAKREAALASGQIEITDVMADNYAKLSELTGVEINIFE